MRIAYFDAGSGISGDMTIGALLDAGAPRIDVAGLGRALGALGVEGYRLTYERVRVGPLDAGSFDVVLDTVSHHHHRDWRGIRALIEKAEGRGLVAGVVERALRIFGELAAAEAAVHGVPIETVHFHEVGAVDAIVDIVGTAWCLEELGIQRCFVGPLPGGKPGYIASEHGRLPVPAPATVRLLEGFPVLVGDGEGELVTPTGAAIVRALAKPLRPLMTIDRVGMGAGKRRWTDRPNVLRVFVGEHEADTDEQIVVLEADIDDMTPAALAFAAERLREAGAIDVTLLPLQMKKGRPGFRVTVLSAVERIDALARTLLTETTSLGVRYRTMGRVVLPRRIESVTTEFGAIVVKIVVRPSGEETAEPEFEDVARAARARGVSYSTVRDAALAAWRVAARPLG
ncbi:MAG TPA: nickel pincer cofactor biosynthesis protein LarC [Candidatus Binatia bacterium]|nr:nickel pincer cofactor biosynthesis protein LarC [Candidatus Binatia bacterium]